MPSPGRTISRLRSGMSSRVAVLDAWRMGILANPSVTCRKREYWSSV